MAWKVLKKLFVGLHMTILVFFSTLKIIRTGFPILCPGTSDPFKNRIELRLSPAHVLVKFRAMPIDFAWKTKTQKSGIKRFVGLTWKLFPRAFPFFLVVPQNQLKTKLSSDRLLYMFRWVLVAWQKLKIYKKLGKFKLYRSFFRIWKSTPRTFPFFLVVL